MVKIYTDTNVLRYFGTAFANASLPADLQVQLLLSPLNLPPGEDTITPFLNRAVINVLNAAKADDLKDDGKEMRVLLDKGKDEAAKNFAAVINGWRSEAQLAEADHRAIFAHSIARRAGTDKVVIMTLRSHLHPMTLENVRVRIT
jgi:hypothetical protein